jgi:integrase
LITSSVTKEKKFIFSYSKDKFGNQSADTILVVPDSIPLDCLLIDIIKHATTETNGYNSVFRYLITNIHLNAFSFLLSKSNQLTLDELINARSNLYQAQQDDVIKKYAVTICSSISQSNVLLKNSQRSNDWCRYRGKSKTSQARQISTNDSLWDKIKGSSSVEEAKIEAQKLTNDLVQSYDDASLKYIKQYQDFLIESKPLLERFENGTLCKDRIVKGLTKLREGLGYDKETIGHLTGLLTQNSKDILSTRVLLSILIQLKLKYLHNTDVWLYLPFSNIHVTRTTITIHELTKGKTSTLLPELFVTNRERTIFKLLTLLIKHCQATKLKINKENMELKRPQLLFDYITSRKKETQKSGVINDFQYLKGMALKRFCASSDIEYLSLDSLRNLSATKKYLDGIGVYELQDLLCHSDLGTTQKYIEQHVISSLLKHNMLVFMREIEDECNSTSDSRSRKYFPIGDGSTCIDAHDSPDKEQSKGELCNGKYCHEGCSNNKIFLDHDSIWQALVKREYYRTNYFSLLSNKEHFSAFESQKILFNMLLCLFIQEKKPSIYSKFMSNINNIISKSKV